MQMIFTTFWSHRFLQFLQYIGLQDSFVKAEENYIFFHVEAQEVVVLIEKLIMTEL